MRVSAPIPPAVSHLVGPLVGLLVGTPVVVLVVALVAALAPVLAPPAASAQQTITSEPTDVVVEIINGSTREPGSAQRVTLRELGSPRQTVAEVGSATDRATLPRAPINRLRDYLVTVTAAGVNYYARVRGSALQRKPVKVYVFDATTSLEGVVVAGMNVVVRLQQSLYDLEILVSIRNDARPQATVRPSPTTFELILPGDASNIQAQLTRGPEPEELEARLSGGRVALAAPLPPGPSQIRLTADIPLDDTVTLPIGTNLAVEKWSVLVAPPTLDIRGMDLEPDLGAGFDEYDRYIGPPLEAGQEYRLTIVRGVDAGPTTEVFTEPAPADEEAAAPGGATGADEDSGGFSPAAVAVPVAVVVLALFLWQRRRRTPDFDDD